MASRPSPNSLIHCAVCGEDYSATYKRCPFCGAKNAPPPPPPRRPVRPAPPPPPPEPEHDYDTAPVRRPTDPDDTYVFDGQDLFDDETGEDYAPARSKGGKRLADGGSTGPFASADINWPRMITFLCSLIIIIAALVIVFTVIYPQLRGGTDPAADSSENPSQSATEPAGETNQPVAPISTPAPAASNDPNTPAATDPLVEPTTNVPPVGPDADTLTAISFQGSNDGDFTLDPGKSHTITLSFNPASWTGDVSWSSSNTEYATVDGYGKVTNVNSTSQLRSVTITVSAGGHTLESKVFCKGVEASEPPAQSDPPAADTQTPSSGNITVGGPGTIVGAEGGLRVRAGPGTDNSAVATLTNGSPIQVISEAGNGWYEITFIGSGGASVTGYIMGQYISTN